MSNGDISNEIINFDELADIRQANIRGSQYELKRKGNDKFIISDGGKLKIGYNETRGVNLKAGNGHVVIAVLPKDDPRCARGLLHGHLGNGFTSNTLEEALVENNLKADTYSFENPQEYQGATYYSIRPVVKEDAEPAEQQAEEAPAQEAEAEAPQAEAVGSENETVNEQGEF